MSDILFKSVVTLYLLLRVYLIVEVFISLRSVPASVHQ